MFRLNLLIKSAVFIVLAAPFLTIFSQEIELVKYEGKLEIGKSESTIIYLGEETGDLSAFCFTNKSPIGRAILNKCQDKGLCEFSGRVNWIISCNAGGNFSAQAKIVFIKSVRKISRRKRV